MKTIEICGKEYPIDCNALTYKNYRSKFNTDIFSDIRTLQAFLTKQVLLAESLKKDNPNIEYNIFKSSENVNIETLLGYKKKNEKHSFLENYNKNC